VPRLWEPLASKHAPLNGYAAKFSLPYLLALMLVNGRAGLADFTDEAVRDEAVLRVARRTTYEIDPSIDYPRHFIGDVRVQLASGEELAERQEHPRGGPDHPMTRDELQGKFRGNAGLFLDTSRVERVLRALSDLETQPRLTGLMDALTP
jgi:2-methylcitrate dehydratase PrpD